MATDSENCERFEKLLKKGTLTDKQYAFCFHHIDNCALNMHTFEAAEQFGGFPSGSLKNWKGVGPLPDPVPSQAKTYRTYRKRVTEMLEWHRANRNKKPNR